MAMSASISLRQSQSLVMTPQLMQSIQLLQMTHLELVQFISQEVEKNPLLDFDANGATFSNEKTVGDDLASSPDEALPIVNASEREDWYQDDTNTLGDHLDTTFENVYDDDSSSFAGSPELPGQWHDTINSNSGESYDLDEFLAARVGLREHLSQQVPLVTNGTHEKLIAIQLLEHLDDTGYLEINAVSSVADRLSVDRAQVNIVLNKLQTLDPPGIFALDLKDCLTIQLRQQERLSPSLSILLNHLDLLAKRDFSSLKRLCDCDEGDVVSMLALIRTLNPRPSAGFETDVVETAIPDIFVKRTNDGGWAVELNPATLPKVLVNESYFAKVSSKPCSDNEKTFLSDCLQSAHWLTRSLDQRAKTMIKVSSEIIRQQQSFLEEGIEHLRPLNLKTVAEAIGMHESTVSRVTSKKFMMTPRGLYELKYFFTASINAVEGGDIHSAESVRHRISKMIAQESAEAVLSDDDIVASLRENGIEIARRTVAKYREALGLGSSVQRRREKKVLR